uniref:Alpha-amylase n=1 Tax=Panagrolaimus superbus TaxID=310955 RepID=A0A914YR32_9BILA
MRRLLSFVIPFIFSILFISINAGNVYQYDYVTTLPDRQTIVHLFEWKWGDIAKECETFLKDYGYGAVQISPPMEHLTVTVNNDMPWWVRYQPVSYKLTSRSGNEAQFKDMVDRCNAVGVRIIVDGVLNHMIGIGQKKGVNGAGSSGDSDFDGTAGVESFPGVPFNKEHTHDSKCNHDIQGSDYQNSAYDVKMCRLVGLIDLDQNNQYVRSKMQEYLNKLLAYGVAGFRLDASKHMWPQDLANILAGVDNVREDIFGPNIRPIVMHEVIDRGGEAVKATDYIEIGRYTNFNFGSAVSSAAKGQSKWTDLLKLGPGFGYGNYDDNDVLNFIDNHDNQRDSNPYVVTYKNGQAYKMAVAYMLAWSYGLPRVMSSFYFDVSDQGPPHDNGNGFPTKSPTFDSNTKTCQQSSGWVCEHRWPEIRKMAQFRQVCSGTAPSVLFGKGNLIAFARDKKGYFSLNGDGNDQTINVDTTLPAGDYCDVFNGELSGSSCTGKKITVGSDGRASFNVPGNSVVAFHVKSRIGGEPSPPSIPSNWKSTVIMIRRPTKPGQDIFLRGGDTQNGGCSGGPNQQSGDKCAIPIAHIANASFFYAEYLSWRQSDNYLDFEGPEYEQGTHDGTEAQGTPTFYTTNDKTAPEYQPYNKYGPDYWYTEVKMDCSKAKNGWFEFKAYENNGVGWESDIHQGSCKGSANAGAAPFSSNNHIGKCGFVNVFEWNESDCTVENL